MRYVLLTHFIEKETKPQRITAHNYISHPFLPFFLSSLLYFLNHFLKKRLEFTYPLFTLNPIKFSSHTLHPPPTVHIEPSEASQTTSELPIPVTCFYSSSTSLLRSISQCWLAISFRSAYSWLYSYSSGLLPSVLFIALATSYICGQIHFCPPSSFLVLTSESQ